MSVSTLDVHPKILQSLRKARIIKITDLLCWTKAQLQRKLGIPLIDVDNLLQAASAHAYNRKRVSLLDVFHGNCEAKDLHVFFTTGCPVLDRTLCGGILVPGVTEICGESSAGKTQLCMQLCLSCQLPKTKNGLGSGVLYISTEDAFPIQRLKQMSDSFSSANQLQRGFMDNIFIEHAGDLDDLWTLLKEKVKPLLEKRRVRLIVVDSIAALFRVEFELDEMAERSHALVKFGKELLKLSREHSVGVLCINQVSDDFKNKDSTDVRRKQVKPALGLTWSYMVTMRIMLSRTTWTLSSFLDPDLSQNESHESGEHMQICKAPSPIIRIFRVEFSPHLDNKEIYFYVDESGVHGLDI